MVSSFTITSADSSADEDREVILPIQVVAQAVLLILKQSYTGNLVVFVVSTFSLMHSGSSQDLLPSALHRIRIVRRRLMLILS